MTQSHYYTLLYPQTLPKFQTEVFLHQQDLLLRQLFLQLD